MTTVEKLEYMYANMKMLHPLTKVVVARLVEVKKKELRAPDVAYIEDVFSKYFPRPVKLKL